MSTNKTNINPLNEYELVKKLAGGDFNAFDALFKLYHKRLYHFVIPLLKSNEDAEDVVQEVFLRLWRTADRFDPGRAKLVTWVMLLTRRHVIDRIRRAAVRPKTTEMNALNEGFGGARESQASSSERNIQLQKCLTTLPEMQRAVIERAYLQGFTLREVSIQLDMPLGTVKSALSRGLARLRSNASEDLPDWAAS